MASDATQSPPEVSVLMPCRNALPFLADAVGSILSQRGCLLELIAVDDGSTDGSLDWLLACEASLRQPGRAQGTACYDGCVAEALAGRTGWEAGACAAAAPEEVARRATPGNSLRVLRAGRSPELPSGQGLALNLALAAASAELIGEMEADDLRPPHAFAALREALAANPEWGGATSQVALGGWERPGMQRWADWQNGVGAAGPATSPAAVAAAVARARFIEIPAMRAAGLYRRSALAQLGPRPYRDLWLLPSEELVDAAADPPIRCRAPAAAAPAPAAAAAAAAAAGEAPAGAEETPAAKCPRLPNDGGAAIASAAVAAAPAAADVVAVAAAALSGTSDAGDAGGSGQPLPGWWPVDTDFFGRWFGRGLALGKLPEPLYVWRQYPEQSTRTHSRCAQQRLRAAKAFFLCAPGGPAAAAAAPGGGAHVELWSCGETLQLWAADLAARGARVLAVHWRPGQPMAAARAAALGGEGGSSLGGPCVARLWAFGMERARGKVRRQAKQQAPGGFDEVSEAGIDWFIA